MTRLVSGLSRLSFQGAGFACSHGRDGGTHSCHGRWHIRLVHGGMGPNDASRLGSNDALQGIATYYTRYELIAYLRKLVHLCSSACPRQAAMPIDTLQGEADSQLWLVCHP